MQNVSSKITLSGTANEAREFFYLFMKISIEPEKMLLVLLYSLSAYTAYFYEKCKIDGLRSVLYLSAPTGTGKTSVAKILASAILNDGEKQFFDLMIQSLHLKKAYSKIGICWYSLMIFTPRVANLMTKLLKRKLQR